MDEKNVVVPRGMERFYKGFHFAPAVKDGNRLYGSGVIGIGADGRAAADPETQFTQAFEALASVLAAAGASFADVIEMTDVSRRPTSAHAHLHAGEGSLLRAPYPAWTAIGITELAVPGGLVEIKVIAAIGS
jgi:enamine deaminase RidA (YjgF/YER057c/UK114 family)